MKRLAVVISLVMLALLPVAGSAHEGAGDTTSVTISPGSFSATLEVIDGRTELIVIDATGSGRGWWVTLECTCIWTTSGPIQSTASDPAKQAPHWDGTTLIAGPDQGMGTFYQTILASDGQWIISSGQGISPS